MTSVRDPEYVSTFERPQLTADSRSVSSFDQNLVVMLVGQTLKRVKNRRLTGPVQMSKILNGANRQSNVMKVLFHQLQNNESNK